MRLIHTINIALSLALIALSINAYPDLPERIPLHFGLNGEPDRWGSPSLLSWLMLPLIGVATVVFLYITAAVVPRYPKSFNVPDRKKFMELPSHLQQWVMRGILNVMHVLSTTILVTFGGIQYGAWESAHSGGASSMLTAAIVFSLVSTPFVTIAFFAVSQRRVDAAWRAFQADGEEAAVPA